MYDLQAKINCLKNKSIATAINNLKVKLTNKGITYPQNTSLRYLIALIPNTEIIKPIQLIYLG